MASIGAAIRMARETKRMSLRALGKAVGLSAPFLSDIEHDRRGLTEDTARKLEAALGVALPCKPKPLTASDDFCRWLQGFVELTRGQQPDPGQWKSICEHLGLVFNKQTPVVDELADAIEALTRTSADFTCAAHRKIC